MTDERSTPDQYFARLASNPQFREVRSGQGTIILSARTTKEKDHGNTETTRSATADA